MRYLGRTLSATFISDNEFCAAVLRSRVIDLHLWPLHLKMPSLCPLAVYKQYYAGTKFKLSALFCFWCTNHCGTRRWTAIVSILWPWIIFIRVIVTYDTLSAPYFYQVVTLNNLPFENDDIFLVWVMCGFVRDLDLWPLWPFYLKNLETRATFNSP